MSWRAIGPGGQFVTGDVALDELSRATARIASAYRERFGRPPVAAEVLYALRIVLAADDELLADHANLASSLPSPTFPTNAPPRMDEYEGTFAEAPSPDGTHYVSRRATHEDVISCRLRVEGRTLLVDYTLLSPSVDEASARGLIGWVLLRQYTADHYRPLVDQVSWASSAAPQERTVTPYP